MSTNNFSSCLIKGLIDKDKTELKLITLHEKIINNLLPINQLYKIIWNLIILLSECQHRFNIKLRYQTVKTIYVLEEGNDPNVFIDFNSLIDNNQQDNNLLNIIIELIKSLQMHLNPSKEFSSIQLIIEWIKKQLFPRSKCLSQEQIIEQLFGITITKTIYNQPSSKIYLGQTPQFINSQKQNIIIKWTNETDPIYEYREIELLEKLQNCDRASKLYYYCKFDSEKYLFMEKYHLTLEELDNKIGKNNCTNIQYIHLFKEIISALIEIHKCDIYHRDIKPANIIFDQLDEQQEILGLRCVLIDFDRSKKSQSQNVDPSFYTGTAAFYPPEGIQNQYDSTYDVWQIGYLMLCSLQRGPVAKYHQTDLRPYPNELYINNLREPLANLQKLYPQFYTIIVKMIDINPHKRITLKQALQELQDLKE